MNIAVLLQLLSKLILQQSDSLFIASRVAAKSVCVGLYILHL